MSDEDISPSRDRFLDRLLPEERRAEISRKRIEIASTILLALATIATAWSGYQSARWNGEQVAHSSNAVQAMIMTGKFANLAEQKQSLQVTLFGQYAEAVSAGNTAFANFLFKRFPEPLRTATIAWQATKPLTNSSAPGTPFEMPEYALTETAEAKRWEDTSITELAAAQAASEISDRFLLFTIIFASVLFFGGVSGKFGSQPIDLTVFVLGTLVLVIGLIVLFATPIR